MEFEWRTVKSGRRRRRPPVRADPRLHDDELPLDRLRALHVDLVRRLGASRCVAQLSARLASLPAPGAVLCLGLGRPSASAAARAQAALLAALAARLALPAARFCEPALRPEDAAFLRAEFGPAAVQAENREGREAVDGPTLLFLPHCPLPLLNNLLYANWQPACLPHLLLLGNSVCDASEMADGAEFVAMAAGLVAEAAVDWDELDGLGRHFTGMALQWFPDPPPPAAPLWRKGEGPAPDYRQADLGELVPA